MSKFKIDSEYEQETKKYMKDIIIKLSDDNGEINPEWIGSMIMLAENFNTFIKCKKQIAKDGLLVKNRFGDMVNHSLIKVQNDAQIQCFKLVQEFMLSKKSSVKLGEVNDNDESPLLHFVKNSIEKR